MESDFILKATDREAKSLFDSQLATVKLMTFLGDKEQYPEMDFNNNVVHKWQVKLRHREDIGEIEGCLSYATLMNKLKKT